MPVALGVNGGVLGSNNLPTATTFRGVFTPNEVARAIALGFWPVNKSQAVTGVAGSGALGTLTVGTAADPYFEYTTLLLPGNGTNGAQNNTFLDSSTNNFTITRNGNTTQGTFSPFSQTGWGNYFNGSSRLSSSTGNVLNWGTNNFTVEMWVYLTTTSSNMMLLEGPSNNDFQLFVESGILKAGFGGAGVSVSYTLPSTFANTWNHIAVVRSGTSTNQTALYVNGVSQSTGTWSSSGAATGFQIARTSAYTLYGYVSGVRVIQNQALTSGNFTPPTAQVTTSSVGWTGANVAGSVTGTVSLLLCTSNRFVDSSGTVSTITIGGSPTVVAFSPFNPTASWSAATNGGSGYFDGNGDYLSIPNSANLNSTGDFTIEGWAYITSASSYAGMFSMRASTGTTNGASITFINTGYIEFAVNPGGNNLTTPTPLNQWFHVALVRSGSSTNNCSCYLNGTRVAQFTSTSQANGASNGAVIGRYYADGTNQYWVTGYLSNVRYVVGTAVYSGATITVPTTPLTAISGTQFLCNFTNAGIYDATSKNDLETVGNAQISTTQSKWGGSSISFDGTGDWLLIPDQPPQRIGTGNFTVEMWVYRNSSGTYGLAGKGTGTTGWLLSLNSSNQVVFTYGSSTITSTGTVSATTWTHIAVVREGTSTNQTKIYISGSNDGTGTVSTDFNQTNSMYIGADRTGGSAANAYVQDVRITNYARYTSNFTAPTAAFPTL